MFLQLSLCIIIALQVSKSIHINELSKDDLIAKVVHLEHQVALLQKMVFGPRSDRFKVADEVPTNQLSLGVTTEAIAQVEVKKTTIKEHDRVKIKLKAKKHPGRTPLPSSLRREEIIIEPQEDVTGLTRLEDEVTEVLEVKAAEFYVKRYLRRKYVRRQQEGIAIGKLPNRAIEIGIPGASVLAMLIVGKFVDHLPVYRQNAIFKRSGINLHYNTVLDWTNQGIDMIVPLYELQKRKILSCLYLQADETGLKVLDSEKNGGSHQGYLWAYRDVLSNLVLFEYQRGRNKEAPAKMLKDFKGYLQTDGYAAYNQFNDRDGITTLCCMAHARRYFKEAEQNDMERSTYALLALQEIYAQEREMKDFNAEERTKLRQEIIAPKLEVLHKWMIKEYAAVIPKSPIGTALAYSLKRWKELTVFITDGRLEIDNNKIENEIRPIALGRKNFMFAGSHESAQRIAMIYSLLASCKVNGIEPMQWLTRVFEELPNRTVNNIEDLLPQKK
ncbi:MAG: IS66 family transposase [Chryseolinea sp.]